MADLIRQATIHKGYDPRDFVLVAFGGAGPVHAHAFGADLGVKRIIVPVTASVHSAYGIRRIRPLGHPRAPPRIPHAAGQQRRSAHVDAAQVNAILRPSRG